VCHKRNELLAKLRSNLDEAKEKEIFFSYSWAYKSKCDKFCSLLTKIGFSVWYDNNLESVNPEMKPGDDFKNRMKESVKHSKVFLLFISPEYVKSENCLIELYEAFLSGIKIIPIIVSSLKSSWTVNFLDNEDSKKHLKALCKDNEDLHKEIHKKLASLIFCDISSFETDDFDHKKLITTSEFNDMRFALDDFLLGFN
jgi:hypothetical protein